MVDRLKRICVLCLLLLPVILFARDLGDVSTQLKGNVRPVTKLIIGIAYLSGIGFGIAAVFKLK